MTKKDTRMRELYRYIVLVIGKLCPLKEGISNRDAGKRVGESFELKNKMSIRHEGK
ncbi:hypothetical protein MEZE111188_03530 [Mesobacillus zeae]